MHAGVLICARLPKHMRPLQVPKCTRGITRRREPFSLGDLAVNAFLEKALPHSVRRSFNPIVALFFEL